MTTGNRHIPSSRVHDIDGNKGHRDRAVPPSLPFGFSRVGRKVDRHGPVAVRRTRSPVLRHARPILYLTVVRVALDTDQIPDVRLEHGTAGTRKRERNPPRNSRHTTKSPPAWAMCFHLNPPEPKHRRVFGLSYIPCSSNRPSNRCVARFRTSRVPRSRSLLLASWAGACMDFVPREQGGPYCDH